MIIKTLLLLLSLLRLQLLYYCITVVIIIIIIIILLLKCKMLFNQLIHPGEVLTSLLSQYVTPVEKSIPDLQPRDIAELVISVLVMPERIQV